MLVEQKHGIYIYMLYMLYAIYVVQFLDSGIYVIACAYTSGSRGFVLSSFLHYDLWASGRSVYSTRDVNVITAIKILSLTARLSIEGLLKI